MNNSAGTCDVWWWWWWWEVKKEGDSVRLAYTKPKQTLPRSEEKCSSRAEMKKSKIERSQRQIASLKAG